MNKHDDDFGAALRRVTVNAPHPAMRAVQLPKRAPSVAIVARPTAITRPQLPNQVAAIPLGPQAAAIQAARTAFSPQPSYATAVRPVATNAAAMAVASPAGQAAAIKAAGLVNTTPYMTGGGPAIPMGDAAAVMAKSPADLAAAAFGPNTSGNGVGAPADGYTGGVDDNGAMDSGQSTDWDNSNQSDTSWDPPAATSGTPSTALAIVPPTQTQVAVAPVKESFWSKLLSLFGFGKKPAVASTVHGERHEPNSVPAMVASVVSRSRNGDQNAMALMALVRDNAAKGNAKAQETFALLTEYVRTHPVSNPRIGYDPDYVALTQAPGTRWAGDPTFSDAVALSHGPTLTNARIEHMLSRFSGEQRAAIRYGIKNKDAHHSNPAVRIGRILGHARRLQAVRMAGSSMTKFDPRIGVEFGE